MANSGSERNHWNIQVQGILFNVKTIQPFREDKKIEFAINNVSLHEKMKPSDHSGTTMLSLSSHGYLHAISWIQRCSPFNKCKNKKRCLERINVLKKNNSPFHLGKISRISIQTSADSWIRQASKWLGPWHQALLSAAPWSSWFWGARGFVWMSLPVSALNGKHHSGFTIWNDKKTTCFACSMRLSEMDMHHPIFFLQKSSTQNVNVDINNMFQTSLSNVCQPVDIENFSVSIPPAYKTFQFRCRLGSATCPTKPQKRDF